MNPTGGGFLVGEVEVAGGDIGRNSETDVGSHFVIKFTPGAFEAAVGRYSGSEETSSV